jgi:hypothetical protein
VFVLFDLLFGSSSLDPVRNFCFFVLFFIRLDILSCRYVAGIESELARGNSDASKFYRFLYVDYYLEYLEQFKGTSELSNDAYIGVRGVRATHLDALSVNWKKRRLNGCD